MQFRIGRDEIRRRDKNLLYGTLFGICLCLLTWQGHTSNSEKYNATLMMSVLFFVIVFGLVNMVRHVRYRMKIQAHMLEVVEGSIIFRTGSEVSTLDMADIQSVNQQTRWREGLSLVLKLKNNRIIRLVGYDEMDRLIDLIKKRTTLSEK